MNSRDKGKRGELELAAFLREHGYEAKRGQQHRGGSDSPDVVALPGVYIECKRTERFAIYEALDQAIRDSAGVAVPVVFHRCNRKVGRKSCRGEWLVVLTAEDFLNLYHRSWV